MSAMPSKSFDDQARIFNDDAGDQQDDPGRLVALAVGVLEGVNAHKRRVEKRRDYHATRVAKLDRLESRSVRAAHAALLALKRAIIEADPRPIPSDDEWFHGHRPIWKASIGGTTYALVAGSGNSPTFHGDDDPAELAALVILDHVDLAVPAREPEPVPDPLTPAERTTLQLIRDLGDREAFDRLMLTGAYQVIWDTVQRLGGDAVADLRRIVAEGGAA